MPVKRSEITDGVPTAVEGSELEAGLGKPGSEGEEICPAEATVRGVYDTLALATWRDVTCS